MDDSFAQLLRECRKEAKLKQQELGQKIHYQDGSMISRFESGRTPPPSPSILQGIINVLALYDVPREKLDRLWEAAGYYSTQIETPVADPVVAFIQQEFEKLDSEERKLLSQDIRSVVEIAQAYFSATKASGLRKWAQAGEDLLSLRDLLERRIQHWYLRIDEKLGWCRYSDGYYTEAVQHYESALWSARQLNNLRKEGEILIRLGDAHRRLGGGQDWDIAHERYTAAKEIFENLGNRIRVADCIRKLAGVYLFQGRPDKAEPLCEESLRICKDQGHNRGLYKAVQHKAWVCRMLGRWGEATQLCEEALAMVNRVTSDDWELTKALMYLGDAYRLQRRIGEAKKTYEEALDILLKYEDMGIAVKLFSGTIQLGLGKVYLKQPGQELQAKLLLNESLEAYRDLKEDFRVAEALSEQGDLLLRLGRLEEAEIRLQQASERLKRLGNTFYYTIALVTLCELYYEKTDFDRVYRTAKAARSVDNGLIDYQLARIELIVGRARIDQGEYVEAIDSFCVASDRALKFNDETFREVCKDIFSEVDRVAQEGAPDVALRLCESYIGFWENKLQQAELAKQELAREWLENMRQEQAEVRALVPID